MEFKTPYFLIKQDELDANFAKLKDALGRYWPNSIVGYSYKTNALPWVINHFKQLGCYAEVVSEDEYNLSKMFGYKNDIIYNGPIKTKETFIEALRDGCFVNIDSQREIDWLSELDNHDYKLGIRINFNIEADCPSESQCGDEGGRFGFCYENGECEKALNRIVANGKRISGIHLHTSSKTRSLNIYKSIAQMAKKIIEEYSLELVYLDVGGGFFGGVQNKPQFEDYIRVISHELGQTVDRCKLTLIVEPGMSVIGAPVDYVTSVIDVKDTAFNRFVITDGSRTSIDPLMTKTCYSISRNSFGERPVLDKQIICGFTCMEHDRLYEAQNDLEFEVGDRITYQKVGAYTMCLSPLFIKYYPDVYVQTGRDVIKVREAWTPSEYVQKSRI